MSEIQPFGNSPSSSAPTCPQPFRSAKTSADRVFSFQLLSLLLVACLLLAFFRASASAEGREYPLPPTGWKERFALGELRNLSGKLIFSAKIGSLERIAELDLDGRRVWMLVDGPGNNINPAWSPAGDQFAFVSDRNGSKQLFLSSWDGTKQRPIRTDLTGIGSPAWSSDGRKLFVAADGKRGSDTAVAIYAVNVENGMTSQIVSAPGKSITPDSSVKGRYLAFSTNRYWPGWDICSISSPNGKESCFLTGNSNFYYPRWAPKSELLAYTVRDNERSAIGIYNVATRVREYETDTGSAGEAAWSKDEKVLAFTSKSGASSVYNIYYVDREAPKVYPLLSSPYSVSSISWNYHKTRELEAEQIRALSDSGSTTLPSTAQ